MAKNKISDGNMLRAVAPAGGVVSGVAMLIGAIFTIPAITAAVGEPFNGHLCGEWELPKVSADTPAAGAKAYWDDTAKKVTTTATANTLIGVFTEARGNGDTDAYVRLNGVVV